MRVTRPVSLSPTRRHDWKSCTEWRLDARLTSGRGLPQAALTACLKSLPFVNTSTIPPRKQKCKRTRRFFLIFLKRCNSTACDVFTRFAPKKSCGRAKKTPQKRPAKAAERHVSAHPVLDHPKLEKSRVKFFKRQKKQKTDRASEKKYAKWLH